MNPATDCPICFEEYAEQTDREHRTAPCCGQSLCRHCSNCLQRCPFCRETWHGCDGDNQWQRRGYPNPVFAAAGFCLRHPLLTYMAGKLTWNAGGAAITGLRGAAASASLVAAEASPAVVAGSVAGAAAVAGGAALYAASRHQECQSNRLRRAIRRRGQRKLCHQLHGTSYHDAASQLFDSLQWHLSPQKKGMPHVYHGSVWRSAARERHLSQLRDLCVQVPPSTELTSSDRLWGDLMYCFMLWLEYNPHTANWGTSPTYGSSPFGLCWHNRWREDMRHAISDLARCLLSEQRSNGLNATEQASAFCLLVTLDHVLSWEVTTPGFGDSDIVQVSWHRYHDFCETLLKQFALAWATARAPESEIDLLEYGVSMDVSSHMEVMAARQIPDTFRGIW